MGSVDKVKVSETMLRQNKKIINKELKVSGIKSYLQGIY